MSEHTSPETTHAIPVRQESEAQEIAVEHFEVSTQLKRLIADEAFKHSTEVRHAA